MMRTPFKALALGLAMILSSCSGGSSSCRNEVLDTIANPTAKLSAIVFNRNCGATTGDNIQVSIVAAGSVPDGKGNALVMDQAPAYSAAYRPAWQPDGTVMLTIPHGARVFAKNAQVDSTRVVFKQM